MNNFKQAPTVLPKNKIHIINLCLHLLIPGFRYTTELFCCFAIVGSILVIRKFNEKINYQGLRFLCAAPYCH